MSADTARPVRHVLVVAWAMWNAGAAAYHTVILTFVFSIYLTGAVGRDLPGPIDASAWLGYATGAAGALVAVLAPVAGRRVDETGRRKRATLVWTALTTASMAALVAIREDWHWLALGLVLLGLGLVFSELATVSYNAMLRQITTSATIGRISGFGWAMGYLGGVVLLLVVYVGLVAGDGGLLRAPTADGLNVRLVGPVAAAWFATLSVPLFLAVPDTPAAGATHPPDRRLGRELRTLFTADRDVLLFLIASALYRDGLMAIAAFAGVVAVAVYDFDPADVLVFGISASVVAAAGALAGGLVEDRVGPKTVIMGSLVAMVLLVAVLLLVSGPTMFWVLGLGLSVFNGPAQSSSRTFLARMAPPGREGWLFGLYTSTGRAVSFLAPTLFGLLITLTGTPRAGIAAIFVVLLAGTLTLVPVRSSAATP
jgi:UMF1 family MFS transporter